MENQRVGGYGRRGGRGINYEREGEEDRKESGNGADIHGWLYNKVLALGKEEEKGEKWGPAFSNLHKTLGL